MGVREEVGVGDGPGVMVDVGVLVGLGVRVDVGVGDGPGVTVLVGVLVAVGVRVLVGVGDGPGVTVEVGVLVAVGVRVDVADGNGIQVPTAPRSTRSSSEVVYVTEMLALPAVLNERLWFVPRSNEAVTGDFPGSVIV